MSEFMNFLEQNLSKDALKILRDKFGGLRVYVSQDNSKNEAIIKAYSTTSGRLKERIISTREILKAQGIFVGIKKIRWVVGNDEKKRD